jgi:hypothetical protein
LPLAGIAVVDGIEHQFDPGRDSQLGALGIFQRLPGLCRLLNEEVKLSIWTMDPHMFLQVKPG